MLKDKLETLCSSGETARRQIPLKIEKVLPKGWPYFMCFSYGKKFFFFVPPEGNTEIHIESLEAGPEGSHLIEDLEMCASHKVMHLLLGDKR